MAHPATVAIRAPIPLDTDLTIVAPANDQGHETNEPWRLNDPTGTTIIEATAWEPDCPDTAAITVADAEAAHRRFPLSDEVHPVPHCFVCGIQPDTMHVRSGPLGDGRFATPWTPPSWTSDPEGIVDPAFVWSALDCTAAMFVGCDGAIRTPVTAQLAVEVLAPLFAERTYALVAWNGNWTAGGWDGRKRGAASAAFDDRGNCVARSTSFWIALE